jgi:hypothetical protein
VARSKVLQEFPGQSGAVDYLAARLEPVEEGTVSVSVENCDQVRNTSLEAHHRVRSQVLWDNQGHQNVGHKGDRIPEIVVAADS